MFVYSEFGDDIYMCGESSHISRRSCPHDRYTWCSTTCLYTTSLFACILLLCLFEYYLFV